MASMHASLMTIPARVTDAGLHATLNYIHAQKPKFYKQLVYACATVASGVLAAIASGNVRTGLLGMTSLVGAMAIFGAPHESRRSPRRLQTPKKPQIRILPSVHTLPTKAMALRKAWLGLFPNSLEVLLTDPNTGMPRTRHAVFAAAIETPHLLGIIDTD